MRKYEMREMLTANISQKRLFRYLRKKCTDYHQFAIFISMGKDLLLGLNEDDFIFDGFSIIRFRDLTKLELKGDLYEEIIKKENPLDGYEIPEIRLESWEAVFHDLHKMSKNIIVEKESIYDDSKFRIGKIERVYKNSVHLRHFDANGIWEESLEIFPYSEITSVTFGSRYVDVFSKYV